MKKLILTLTLLLTTQTFASGINWVDSYKKALAIATKEHKPILFVMKKHGCRYCKKLENETFSDQKVIKKINDKLVAIKIYADDPKSCMPYQLAVYTNGFPTLWFLKPNGNILMGFDQKTMQPYAFKIPGFVNAQMLGEIVDDAVAALGSKGGSTK